jgi:tetratricopeptide (TPR) repeat protein
MFLRRPEDAVTHFRQALDRYVALHDVAGEGSTRANLAQTLIRLRRSDDARQEIERAIECNRGLGHAAEPWKAWGILADIEHHDKRHIEAHEAYIRARDAYLAYVHGGGEARAVTAPLFELVGQLLVAGDTKAAKALVQQKELDSITHLAAGLRAVVSGVRDPSFADIPGHDYYDGAEFLLLLERLKAAGR